MKTGILFFSIMMNLSTQFIFGASKSHIITRDFTKIKISTGFKVKIVQGEECKLNVNIDKEYEKYLRVRVTSLGELQLSVQIPGHIKAKLHSGKRANYSAIITLPKLESIKLSDAASLESEGIFMVDRFIGCFSDASIVQKLELKGKDENSDINIIAKDASNINMTINSYQCAIKVREAANAAIDGNFYLMETEVQNASKIQIKGIATFARYKSSGNSSIDASKFIVKDVSLYSKQASSVNIYILHCISEFSMSGSPQIKLNSPGLIQVGFRKRVNNQFN